MKNFFNNLKNKMKSYGFWVSLSSALILLLTSLGNAFGFEIENKIVEDIVMSVAGILVVFGVVSMNDKSNKLGNITEDIIDNETENKNNDDNKSETKVNMQDNVNK